MIYVYKQHNGNYRWVLASSNAYRDRDRQIVSKAALEADVDRADKEVNYGPLRWWHVGEPDPINKTPGPGLDIGECDFNAMHGKFLIESGTFKNARIGEAVMKNQAQLRASIGFFHPISEPDGDGVFHHIRRFERSLLPSGSESNPFQSFVVLQTKEVHDMLDKKLKAFKKILDGDEALVDQFLGSVDEKEKSTDAAGVQSKEKKEDTPGPAPEPEPDAEVQPEPEPEADVEPSAAQVKEVVDGLTEAIDQIVEEKLKSILSASTKELNDKITPLQTQLKDLSKKVSSLMTSEVPKSVSASLRASQSDSTVVEKAAEPTGDPKDNSFVAFVMGSGQE